MIKGSIELEDTLITFGIVSIQQPEMAHYTVKDQLTGKQETHVKPWRPFMKALAIAIHPDGEGNDDDYKEAETLFANGEMRWIP